jgi:hypothetical protein
MLRELFWCYREIKVIKMEDRERQWLEYLVWLNQKKIDYYTRNPLYRGREQEECLSIYRGLINKHRELLSVEGKQYKLFE